MQRTHQLNQMCETSTKKTSIQNISLTVIFCLFLLGIKIYSTPYMNGTATMGGVFKAYVFFYLWILSVSCLKLDI